MEFREVTEWMNNVYERKMLIMVIVLAKHLKNMDWYLLLFD